MRIVFRRLPHGRRRTVQRVDHAVEFGGDIGEFRDLVAAGKEPGARTIFADLARPRGKAAQPRTDTQQRRKCDRHHDEVDSRGDPYRRGRPIRLAQVERRKGLARQRCDHRPTPRRSRQRRYRGDDLGTAARPAIDRRERDFSAAALRHAVEHSLLREQLPFRCQVALFDRRPGGHVVEVAGRRARRRQQQLDRRYAADELRQPIAQRRQLVVAGRLECRQHRLADRTALLADAAQQQLLARLIGGAELQVQEQRDKTENHRQTCCLAGKRSEVADSPPRTGRRPSGSRSRRSFRSGQSCRRHRETFCGSA
jgi:hypothetical protein